jgi:hypothetical protein
MFSPILQSSHPSLPLVSCTLVFHILRKDTPLEKHLITIKLFIRSNARYPLYPIYYICFTQSPPMQYIVYTPPDAPIYNNAITAPTTPNSPTPTFTVPAALFPLAVAPAALPLLVPVPVELADVLVVLAPLALPVLVVPALALVCALPVVDPETAVEGTAEETVLVESIENWFE